MTFHLGQASAQNGTFTSRLRAALPSENAPNFVLLLLVSYQHFVPPLLLLLFHLTSHVLLLLITFTPLLQSSKTGLGHHRRRAILQPLQQGQGPPLSRGLAPGPWIGKAEQGGGGWQGGRSVGPGVG